MKIIAITVLIGIIAIAEWRSRKNGYRRTVKEMDEHFIHNAETQQQQIDTIQRMKNEQPNARNV